MNTNDTHKFTQRFDLKIIRVEPIEGLHSVPVQMIGVKVSEAVEQEDVSHNPRLAVDLGAPVPEAVGRRRRQTNQRNDRGKGGDDARLSGEWVSTVLVRIGLVFLRCLGFFFGILNKKYTVAK